MIGAESDGMPVLAAIANSFAELLFAILSRCMVQTASYGAHVPGRGLDAAVAKSAGKNGAARILLSSWC